MVTWLSYPHMSVGRPACCCWADRLVRRAPPRRRAGGDRRAAFPSVPRSRASTSSWRLPVFPSPFGCGSTGSGGRRWPGAVLRRRSRAVRSAAVSLVPSPILCGRRRPAQPRRDSSTSRRRKERSGCPARLLGRPTQTPICPSSSIAPLHRALRHARLRGARLRPRRTGSRSPPSVPVVRCRLSVPPSCRSSPPAVFNSATTRA